jgi:hypothetical protein
VVAVCRPVQVVVVAVHVVKLLLIISKVIYNNNKTEKKNIPHLQVSSPVVDVGAMVIVAVCYSGRCCCWPSVGCYGGGVRHRVLW